ncbi:hypothetical protein KUL42_22780 [Alteromonas sp. KUL42]|uniref:hypothetical protein n=1 Tax=Alteromonas sp. KUL42 TaxID=2480797 RepID=UPI0010FFBC63|nr:hypothetical protein [Alteromonas sp. KUL42]GEA07517.1 hypothetical protein KUL42_22780 [Alteromonas sp. KUL42]
MNTILSNWQVVTIIEGEHKIGKVLWGICVDDMTCRFSAGDYVCTSRITDFNSYTKLVKTTSGSLYQILGEGK